MQPQSIAIVGAGFSGTLLSLQLLRHCPPTTVIHLIEQSAVFGAGLAYSSQCTDHLLNVPAGRMSAFPDRPSDFQDWLGRQPTDQPGRVSPDSATYAPRQLYGQYLQTLLAEAVHAWPDNRLVRVRGKTVAISRQPAGLRLHLDEGRTISVSAAVIATGNNQPADPCPSLRATSFYRPSPWASDIADGLAPGGQVLLIGTGLTMIDTVLLLLQRGHRGPIHALSRRGLLPHAHVSHPVTPQVLDRHEIPRRLSELLHFIRSKSAICGSWHAVVDALRPMTQELWRAAPAIERQRFLTHLRPWWDVHRHRMAPAVAARIAATRTSGQLRIHAGRVTGCAEEADALAVAWQPRRASAAESFRVQRVINCTGPETDVTRTCDPLFQSLLDEGMARPDPLGLGFDITDDGAFLGNAANRLFGVGPICRAALWEITAVPDIRTQCEGLAQRIACMARQRDAADWFPHSAAVKTPGLWL